MKKTAQLLPALLVPVLLAGCAATYMPIHRAAESGDSAEVERLLAQGVDVNERIEPQGGNMTPLMLAALHGRTETVKVLLAHGADVFAVDYFHTTARQWALRRGHTEIAALIKTYEDRRPGEAPAGLRTMSGEAASGSSAGTMSGALTPPPAPPAAAPAPSPEPSKAAAAGSAPAGDAWWAK